MKTFLLINPNTNQTTTLEMVAIAQSAAPCDIRVEGATVLRGASLIFDDEKLAVATEAVIELALSIDLCDHAGIVVSAFGDPGIEDLRRMSPVPVTGIAEAGILEAARGGRRFSIVTTTPDLVWAINRRVARYGFADAFTGVRLTDGEVVSLMEEPARLAKGLARACEAAISEDGAEAIIIGGGPLASQAAALKWMFPVPIIEPVPAAIRLAISRAHAAGTSGLQPYVKEGSPWPGSRS